MCRLLLFVQDVHAMRGVATKRLSTLLAHSWDELQLTRYYTWWVMVDIFLILCHFWKGQLCALWPLAKFSFLLYCSLCRVVSRTSETHGRERVNSSLLVPQEWACSLSDLHFRKCGSLFLWVPNGFSGLCGSAELLCRFWSGSAQARCSCSKQAVG